jgi:hypothetical protein
MMKRAAELIRTGDIITTVYARPGWTLDVAYPVRERFVSPEGVISDVVRYCGFDNFGTWVEKVGGHRVGQDVILIRDAHTVPAPWGEIGRAAAVIADGAEDELL